jgi:hypothetical protein
MNVFKLLFTKNKKTNTSRSVSTPDIEAGVYIWLNPYHPLDTPPVAGGTCNDADFTNKIKEFLPTDMTKNITISAIHCAHCVQITIECIQEVIRIKRITILEFVLFDCKNIDKNALTAAFGSNSCYTVVSEGTLDGCISSLKLISCSSSSSTGNQVAKSPREKELIMCSRCACVVDSGTSK